MPKEREKQHTHKGKVLVAISGGVDSAVAAAILKKEGYDCEAVFMRLIPPQLQPSENIKGHLKDAQLIAEKLQIPLHIVDLSWDMQEIINYFIYEYSNGRTPNPCVKCNTRLKFGKLLAFARHIGAEYLATGHYARITTYAGYYRLAKARSIERDQSYFLFGIDRIHLGSILMPIGQIDAGKEKIRKMAEEFKLPVSQKEDSQEICFVPDNDYTKLIARLRPDLNRPGKIVDLQGNLLGEHDGIFRFTIGQRRGLKIAAGYPLYVVKIDPSTATVVVGPHEALARKELIASDVNWHIAELPARPITVQAKIRSTHKPTEASLEIINTKRVRLVFKEQQFAITPGQAVVFYQDDYVLGGGWIE